MGGSRNGKVTSKKPIVLNVMLKICLAVLLMNLAPYAGAIRAGQLSSDGNAVDNVASPNDLIAENPYGLYENGDDRANTVEASKASGLALRSHHNSSLNADVKSFGCNVQQDLQYTQQSGYPPNGLPIFLVTFTNTCLDCTFSQIHIRCGQFTSGKLVNPRIFRRLAYNDCFLNNGLPLAPEDTITFEYISSLPYPMTVGFAQSSCPTH